MIISSRSRVSNLLFSSSCINWVYATRATPGLLATVRNASLWVRRAGIPIASPSSRARSSDTIGTRAVISLSPCVRELFLGWPIDHQRAQFLHVRQDRGCGVVLHHPIERQDLAPHRGQPGAAAADAALRGLDQGLAEAGVHRLGEDPGAAVAHPHAPPRGGDRAGL